MGFIVVARAGVGPAPGGMLPLLIELRLDFSAKSLVRSMHLKGPRAGGGVADQRDMVATGLE